MSKPTPHTLRLRPPSPAPTNPNSHNPSPILPSPSALSPLASNVPSTVPSPSSSNRHFLFPPPPKDKEVSPVSSAGSRKHSRDPDETDTDEDTPPTKKKAEDWEEWLREKARREKGGGFTPVLDLEKWWIGPKGGEWTLDYMMKGKRFRFTKVASEAMRASIMGRMLTLPLRTLESSTQKSFVRVALDALGHVPEEWPAEVNKVWAYKVYNFLLTNFKVIKDECVQYLREDRRERRERGEEVESDGEGDTEMSFVEEVPAVTPTVKKRRGRPPGSTNKTKSAPMQKTVRDATIQNFAVDSRMDTPTDTEEPAESWDPWGKLEEEALTPGVLADIRLILKKVPERVQKRVVTELAIEYLKR